MPGLLGKVSLSMKRKIKQELELLKNEPLKVLKKKLPWKPIFIFDHRTPRCFGREDVLG